MIILLTAVFFIGDAISKTDFNYFGSKEGPVDLDKVMAEQEEHFVGKAWEQKTLHVWQRVLYAGFPDRLLVFPEEVKKGDAELSYKALQLLNDRPEKVWVLSNCNKSQLVWKSGNVLFICLKNKDGFYLPWWDEVALQYEEAVDRLIE